MFHVLYQPSFSIHYRNGTHQCPSHTHLCATFFLGEQYPRPLLGLFGSQFTALLSVCFNDLSRTPCRPQSQPTLHIATVAPRRALFQRERFTHMARDASPVSITLELPPFVATTGLRWLPSRFFQCNHTTGTVFIFVFVGFIAFVTSLVHMTCSSLRGSVKNMI